MKYKVLSPIRNNGKYYPVDSEISLKEVPEGIKIFLKEIPATASKPASADKPETKKTACPKKKGRAIKKKTISKK